MLLELFFLATIATFGVNCCYGQNLLNPDIGIYTQTWRKFAEPNDDAITDSRLQNLKKRDGKTISNRHYYFQNYQFIKTLPKAWLNGIKADLQTYRKNGFRVSLLFAYSEETDTSKIIDAPIEVVKSHLAQLKPILAEFEPVISTVLCGFIGTWGEGYYTNFYKNDANKSALLKAVLETVPASIPFSVRTPKYFDLIPKHGNYSLAKVGLYDHCILADPSDTGTFPGIITPNITGINETMNRFPNTGTSGETCPNSFPSLLNCNYALRHFAALKMMQLNDGWYSGTINQWKANGCWAKIKAKLGYVLSLVSASSTAVTLINNGWSKPPLQNTVYAILIPSSKTNGTANVTGFKIPLPKWDIRKLAPGQTTVFPMQLTSSSGNITLKENYQVYVRIDTGGVWDIDYRIVLANVVQWGNRRINQLGVTLPKGTKLNSNAVAVAI